MPYQLLGKMASLKEALYGKRFICCALIILYSIYSTVGWSIASISNLCDIFTSELRTSVNRSLITHPSTQCCPVQLLYAQQIDPMQYEGLSYIVWTEGALNTCGECIHACTLSVQPVLEQPHACAQTHL